MNPLYAGLPKDVSDACFDLRGLTGGNPHFFMPLSDGSLLVIDNGQRIFRTSRQLFEMSYGQEKTVQITSEVLASMRVVLRHFYSVTIPENLLQVKAYCG